MIRLPISHFLKKFPIVENTQESEGSRLKQAVKIAKIAVSSAVFSFDKPPLNDKAHNS